VSREPTTADLVVLTRGLFASASSRDFDTLLGHHAHDAVWDLSDAGLGTFAGVAAIRSFLEDWFGTFDLYQSDVEEIIDLGGGVVFAVVNATGRPAGMDASLQQRRGWIALWANGKVVRTITYLDLDEARTTAQQLALERR
jgi:ketosteroid isomerase-like protein